MSEQKDKPIDPFESARRAGGICVNLDVHDVQAVRPGISPVRARALLEMHKATIAHAMLIAGRQVVFALLEGDHAGGT